jgi:hypothetical protein
MGENYLIEQVKHAPKRRDRSLEDMGRPTLFARPDLLTAIYPARAIAGGGHETGEALNAFASVSGPHIDLARGNRRVGIIEGEAASRLREALREPGMPGVVRVRLSEVSPLSGIADASIIRDE